MLVDWFSTPKLEKVPPDIYHLGVSVVNGASFPWNYGGVSLQFNVTAT